jgi:uncharacterized SAM-dependent methyltransferase
VLFLGSTIGNFDRQAGKSFLCRVREILEPGDALLLGTDLEKPWPQLQMAYDDLLGVTAAFNLNLLARINGELDGDFILSNFVHEARFNQTSAAWKCTYGRSGSRRFASKARMPQYSLRKVKRSGRSRVTNIRSTTFGRLPCRQMHDRFPIDRSRMAIC